MAKLVGGPLGSYRGKAGGTIGSSWKGIAVVKSMPLSVANPQTVAQTAQRVKFAACIAAARLLLSNLITTFWNPFAKKMSGINSFVKQNIDCFATGSFSVPGSFYAARGILMGVENLEIEAGAGIHKIFATWDDNSGIGDALATDVSCLCVYNENMETWHFFSDGSNREATSSDFTLDGFEIGNELYCYFFFTRPDNSRVSDSVYKHVIAGP